MSAGAKHIGIVAVSAEGAALCYRTVCVEGATILGRYAHPEVSMHTFPFADYMRAIDADAWNEVGEMMLDSAEKLRIVGAQLLICPDNTVHQGLDLVRDRSPLPWLHIAEEVAATANERSFKKLLVLGTRYLMEGPVYPAKLEARGIASITPDAEGRQRMNAIIFDELVHGRFEGPARTFVKGLIAEGKRGGCDAVVLGCTEIPLLIDAKDASLPILDSTRILARAALRAATASLA